MFVLAESSFSTLSVFLSVAVKDLGKTSFVFLSFHIIITLKTDLSKILCGEESENVLFIYFKKDT